MTSIDTSGNDKKGTGPEMDKTSSSATSDAASPKKKKMTFKEWIIDTIKSLGWALVIVLILRSSVIEAYKIPSGSMIPTLAIGDHIFVNKFAYGLKVPFSDLVAERPVYIVKRDPPKRGDVIVFKYPRDESLNYIKRVVGVPGDTIQIRERILYVNEKPVAKVKVSSGKHFDKVFEDIDGRFFNVGGMDLYEEDLFGVKHSILEDKDKRENEDYPSETVPEGKLFCMGDNRDYSADSRSWGFVPMENVKGKAMFIWFNIWLGFEKSQYYFKPLRIGTWVK